MSQSEAPFVYRVGVGSAAVGKSCAICGAPFRDGDQLTVTHSRSVPAHAVGVHTACLRPSPPEE
jgi:hypothetical protein